MIPKSWMTTWAVVGLGSDMAVRARCIAYVFASPAKSDLLFFLRTEVMSVVPVSCRLRERQYSRRSHPKATQIMNDVPGIPGSEGGKARPTSRRWTSDAQDPDRTRQSKPELSLSMSRVIFLSTIQTVTAVSDPACWGSGQAGPEGRVERAAHSRSDTHRQNFPRLFMLCTYCGAKSCC
jgi:hypothetical protein